MSVVLHSGKRIHLWTMSKANACLAQRKAHSGCRPQQRKANAELEDRNLNSQCPGWKTVTCKVQVGLDQRKCSGKYVRRVVVQKKDLQIDRSEDVPLYIVPSVEGEDAIP